MSGVMKAYAVLFQGGDVLIHIIKAEGASEARKLFDRQIQFREVQK